MPLQLKVLEIFLDQKKKLKQLKIEQLEILRIFLSMKKKINQLQEMIFGVTIKLNINLKVIEEH